MPRYPDPQVIDDAPLLDVDHAFVGVDARHDKATLSAGWSTEAVNMRCRDGIWSTRLGYSKIAWLNKVNAVGVQPWRTIYGIGEYKDPSGRRWEILAADGNVYACLANNYFKVVPLPAGVTITAQVYFTQAVDMMFMWRGSDLAPLVMHDITVGFDVPGDPSVKDSTTTPPTLYETVPNGIRAVFAAGRLWVQVGTDTVWPSLSLNFISYNTEHQISVSKGSTDSLVTLKLFGEDNIICLKGASVWRIGNLFTLTGDALAPGQLFYLTGRSGIIAADSVVDVGTDLLWLSASGFESLTITEQGEIQSGGGIGSAKAGKISDAFEKYFRRLNGSHLSGAVAAMWDDKIYLGVPMDNAEMLGPELCPAGTAYSAGGTEYLTLADAGTYRFRRGAHDASISIPTSVTISSDFTWVQGLNTLHAVSTPNTVTASVRSVAKGVNNACFVYDMRTGTWQGYDVAPGITFQRFALVQYFNKDRLIVCSHDGWVYLAEDGYHDALPQPFVDVFVTALPSTSPADGITIGGGTHVQAGVNWTVTNLALAQQNFWNNGSTQGYNPANTWSSGGMKANRLAGAGVRFTAYNGVLPTITTETHNPWVSIVHHPMQDIATSWTSRGYAGNNTTDQKRGKQLTVHLETWNPSYTVSVLGDGPLNTTTLASDQTQSRTAYNRPFAAAPWVSTNVNNDWATPFRQDYALKVTDAGMKLGDGIRSDLFQHIAHQLSSPMTSWAAQVRVTNATGRIKIIAAGYESREVDHAQGAKK